MESIHSRCARIISKKRYIRYRNGILKWIIKRVLRYILKCPLCRFHVSFPVGNSPFWPAVCGFVFSIWLQMYPEEVLDCWGQSSYPWGMSWICTWRKCYVCVLCTRSRHEAPITCNEPWCLWNWSTINHVELRSRILLCWVDHKGRHHGTISVCSRFSLTFQKVPKEGKEACPKEHFRWRNTLQVLPLTFFSSQTETTTYVIYTMRCPMALIDADVSSLCWLQQRCNLRRFKDLQWTIQNTIQRISDDCSMLQPLLVVWFSCRTIAIMI